MSIATGSARHPRYRELGTIAHQYAKRDYRNVITSVAAENLNKAVIGRASRIHLRLAGELLGQVLSSHAPRFSDQKWC